jgi:hypothetical protein
MKGPDKKTNINKPHFTGVPTRPQNPKDAYGKGYGNCWEPGQVPLGGFRSVYCFDSGDRKNSPTSKPEPQNRIIDRGK